MKKSLPLVAALIALFVVSVHAAIGGRNMVKEGKIEQELAGVNPALVEPFRQARIAADKNDYATAEKLLEDVVRQAPNFDPALRRLGSAKLQTGKTAEGRKLVEQAVAINRSAANLTTQAYALAFPPGGAKPSEQEQRMALGLLIECREKHPADLEDDMMAVGAQLALQTENLAEARTWVTLLKKTSPKLMQTHFFAAYLAATDAEWIEAEDEIRLAGELGLKPEAVDEFLDRGVHTRALTWRWIHGLAWTVVGWVAGLATLFGLGFCLSQITLRHIETSDPRVPVGVGERRLRKIYRWVINFAGAYYYISLPVVMVLVIAVSGAVVYATLATGYIMIKLVIIIVIGAIATIWSMARSLFLRVSSQDPGRELTREEAEGLWKLSAEVARDLDTRPIDEIRITPGTDLCVYERGSWREKLNNRATRVLVIGAGVLNDFKTADFRSVLAHEYGHFSNRDTAGGDIALRVQNDMMKFYIAMVRAGQATWLNVAFHFLRLYHFIFRRISHGATRLQEVLADRVAGLHYGPAAFEGGLRHVIKQNVNFDFTTEREINDAIRSKRPLNNFYTFEPPTGELVHDKLGKVLNRPTTLDDTHPGPTDRFRLISSLPEPATAAPGGYVWDLFKDRDAILKEMLSTVEKNIAPHRAS